MKINIWCICFILVFLIQCSFAQNANFQLVTPSIELDLYEGAIGEGCKSSFSYIIIPPNGDVITKYNITSSGGLLVLEKATLVNNNSYLIEYRFSSYLTDTFIITAYGYFSVSTSNFSFEYICSAPPIQQVTSVKSTEGVKRFYQNWNKYAYFVGIRFSGFKKLFSNSITFNVSPKGSYIASNLPEIIVDFLNFDIILNIPILAMGNTLNLYEPLEIDVIFYEFTFTNYFKPLFLLGQDPPPSSINSTTTGSFSSIFIEYYLKNMTFNSVSYAGIALQPTDFPVLGNPQSCMRLCRFVQDRVIGNSIQSNVITLQYYNQTNTSFSDFQVLSPVELMNTPVQTSGAACYQLSELLTMSNFKYKYVKVTTAYFKRNNGVIKIPYGLNDGNLQKFVYKEELMASNYMPYLESYVNNLNSGNCTFPQHIVDLIPPVILNVAVSRVSQKSSKWNVRLSYYDAISGIAFAYYLGIDLQNHIIADLSNKFQGTITDGILEFQLDSSKQEIMALNSFILMDNAGLKTEFLQKPRTATYLSNNFVNLGNFSYFKFQNQTVVFDEPVTATYVPKPFKNTLYYKLNSRNDEIPLSLSFPTQLFELQTSYFPSFWDDSIQMYRIDFEIPYNFFTQELNYQIMNPTSFEKKIITYDSMVSYFGSDAILKIEATNADQLPPLVSNIVPSVHVVGENIIVQFIFYITEQVNGLAGGFIKIIGDNDPVGFSFDITKDSIANPYEYIVTLSNSYNISNCKNQIYSVSYIELYDRMGRRGVYDTMATQDQGIHPMYKILQNDNSATVTQCTGTDSILPTVTPNSLVVINNENSTKTNINFSIQDSESGLYVNSYPICYLTTTFERRINVTSTCEMRGVGYFQLTNCQCSFEIPFMFGYPDGMLLQIYGIYDNAFNFDGVNHFSFLSQVIPPKSVNIPFISSIEPYYKWQLSLTVKGTNFLSKTISLSDLNGVNMNVINEYLKLTNNNIIISLKTPIAEPFQVVVVMESYQSNTVKVTPIITEIPTTPPGKCLSDCGTPEQGNCTFNGCICYKPWFGDDCRSKVINTTTPQTNTTAPSTGQEYEEELPTGEKVNLSTLISVVGIREVDINGKTINETKFDQWVYTNISTNTHTKFHYSTQISTPQTGLPNYNTTIQITTQWFESNELITFAGETFSINPSTMKYSISISSYKFKSQLSKLQLIFSASIQSNKNNDNDEICSSKQFKESDNTEIESEYIKLSLNTHSLFGRFIKRAIIDDRVTIIDNQLIDQSASDLVPEKSESLIAINIPNYVTSVILDPDFSLLVNPSSNKDDNDSLCSSKKSKGLTKSQLIGIIIGSACAFIIIATITGFFIYKKAKYSPWILSMQNKMKDLKKEDKRKRSIAPVFFGGKVHEVDKF